MAAGRRRRNHGQRTRAADVAGKLIDRRVPRDQMWLARVRDAWREIATSAVATRAWPVAITGGELVVVVHDSQWLHELTYLRHGLLDRITARLPLANIAGIRLRLGEIPVDALRPPPRGDPPAPGRTVLDREPSEETLAALEDVRDPDLRQAIASARVALSRR